MLLNTSHVVSENDKFAKPVNGVYTIDMPSAIGSNVTGLYANVAVADLPVGVYNYKIVKSYPDGRVNTIVDTAAVTSVDGNGIAVFAAGSSLANNAKFLANWTINEVAADFEKGTYTYEFTIGTVTRKYTINVVDRPLLTVSSLTVGTSTTIKYGTAFTLASPASAYAAAKLVINFTQLNIPANSFVSAEVVTGSAASMLTVNPKLVSTSAADTDKIALSGLTSLELGTVTGSPTTAQFIRVRLTFWTRVNHSVDNARFVLLGETQDVILAFLDPVA
jgi:hypothetical protein